MLFVIYGTERYLMDQKLDELKKTYQCFDEMMNYTEYDLSKENMDVVMDELMTPPFLSDHKMVVVRHPLFLTTAKQKKDDQEAELFMKCLDLNDPDIHLVIFHDEENFDKRKKIYKELKKKAKFFNFNALDHIGVSDTVRQAVKKRNCTIDNDAIDLLLNRTGLHLIKVLSEVEKLCLYTKHIDYKSVELLVSKPLEENIFELTNAILKKDRKKMFSIYHDLLIQEEEPVKLLVMIANAMRLQYQVKLLDRKGYNDQEIGKMLGINPYRLRYIRKEGRQFRIDELLGYLDELSKLDIRIKTGKVDKKVGLELFMLRI